MYNVDYKYSSQSLNLTKVIINTYVLLSSTIFFSALMCLFSIYLSAKPISFLTFIILYFVLLLLIDKFKNSSFSLFFVYCLTGFLGYSLGPIISLFLTLKNGEYLIFSSLFLTGFIFFLLSIYVFFTKNNLSFLSSFIFVGFFVILFSFILKLFFAFSFLNLTLSGLFIIFSSAVILYELNSIIKNGDTDYISVTVSLYLSIYNIFVSLLNIFGLMSNND